MNTVCTTYVRPLTVSCDHLEVVVELVVSGQPLGQRCSSFRGDVAHLVQEDLSFPVCVLKIVANKSCSISIKSEKYAFLVTLRPLGVMRGGEAGLSSLHH